MALKIVEMLILKFIITRQTGFFIAHDLFVHTGRQTHNLRPEYVR